jgi:hypothetical protein
MPLRLNPHRFIDQNLDDVPILNLDAPPSLIGTGYFLTLEVRDPSECAGCSEWIRELVVAFPGAGQTASAIAKTAAGPGDGNLNLGPNGKGVKGSCLSSAKVTVYTVDATGATNELGDAFYVLVARKTTKYAGKTITGFTPQEIWISSKPFRDAETKDVRTHQEADCDKVLGPGTSGC